jgi:hypothetical protein
MKELIKIIKEVQEKHGIIVRLFMGIQSNGTIVVKAISAPERPFKVQYPVGGGCIRYDEMEGEEALDWKIKVFLENMREYFNGLSELEGDESYRHREFYDSDFGRFVEIGFDKIPDKK